jgi:hypothetical protein
MARVTSSGSRVSPATRNETNVLIVAASDFVMDVADLAAIGVGYFPVTVNDGFVRCSEIASSLDLVMGRRSCHRAIPRTSLTCLVGFPRLSQMTLDPAMILRKAQV